MSAPAAGTAGGGGPRWERFLGRSVPGMALAGDLDALVASLRPDRLARDQEETP